MLKGCQKKIIFLKNTGSSVFDEAYLVIKPDYEEREDFDIVSEATRIINNSFVGTAKPKKRRGLGSIFLFCAGIIFGAIIATAIALVL